MLTSLFFYFTALTRSPLKLLVLFFFFKQKTAYEILRSDWSSDVCSSDLDVEDDRLVTRGRCLELALDPDRLCVEIGRASCRERESEGIDNDAAGSASI